MTLRAEYSLGYSAYNPFLFASVATEPQGPDTEGDELTVLSALTRLQLDPWQEAARLADLPDDLASRSLAETRQAEECALAECNADPQRKNQDGPCFLYAAGDRVVLPRRAAAPIAAP